MFFYVDKIFTKYDKLPYNSRRHIYKKPILNPKLLILGKNIFITQKQNSLQPQFLDTHKLKTIKIHLEKRKLYVSHNKKATV